MYGYSIYHDMYHKIITFGTRSAEWYDLNKDKAIVFTRFARDFHHVKNVWYSPFNPNILYCIHAWELRKQYKILAIDLREGDVCYYETRAIARKYANLHQSYWLH